jgi:hypothetical protein
MPDDIPRNGSSAGYGADERAQALPARPAAVPAVPAVPPMEAEWLRAVGGHPIRLSGSNGSGPNGADAPPAAGNGPSAGGVDSTRGRH